MDPQSSEPLLRQWSTDGIAPGQRLDYYASTISSMLDPMVVVGGVPDGFRFALTSTDLGPITVIRARGQGHALRRGPRELARSEGEYFRLIVNRASSWNLEQRGAVRVAAGQLVMLDCRYGHRSELTAECDCLHVKVPMAWMRSWVPQPEAFDGKVIGTSPRWGRALATFIEALSPELVFQQPLPPALLTDQLGALLSFAMSDIGKRASASPREETAWAHRIRDVLAQRCSETELTAFEVASDLKISVRALHRFLAATGTTFGELLLAARTDLARRLLSSRQSDRLTIAEVGYRSGFVNASHFSRTLRERTGFTPKHWRCVSRQS